MSETYGNLGATRSAPNNVLQSNLKPLVDSRNVRMYTQSLRDATMFGLGAVAQGGGSCAYGAYGSALQNGTIAVGTYASAKLTDSIAIGAESVGGAYRSIAIGRTATATGPNSMAFGTQTNVTGANGVGIGNTAKAGDNCVAMGKGASATTSAIAIGTSAFAGSSAIAIGNSATVSGGSSIGIGNNIVNAYAGSVAMGIGAVTTANFQFICGSGTLPIKDVFFGVGPTQTGSSVTAVGYSVRGDEPSGANQAGGNLRLAGGSSTGSAAGGDVIFATTTAGAAGSSLNTGTDWIALKPAGKLLPLTTDTVDIGSSSLRYAHGYFVNMDTTTTTMNGVAYTWPSTSGSSNQALTTNGSGGLSWAAAGGAGQMEPLTNGDPVNPQIIFAGGDVVMVMRP